MIGKAAIIWLFSVSLAMEMHKMYPAGGSACKLHDGNVGVCKPIENCTWVHKQLLNRSISFRQIVTCGFDRHAPIVCCEDVQPDIRAGGPVPEVNSEKTVAVTRETTSAYRLGISGEKINEACRNYSRLAVSSLFSFDSLGPVVDLTEHPHMAALGYLNDEGGHDFRCSGSLISEKWIVTAAHCIKRRYTPSLVRMGVVWLNRDQVDPVDRTITRMVRHPSYRFQNDIALIQLNEVVPFSDYVRPACVLTQLGDISNQLELTVAGWGSTEAETGKGPSLKHRNNVRIEPLESCNATLLRYKELKDHPGLMNGLIDSQICAAISSDEGATLCSSDLEGPIFITHRPGVATLVGVQSFAFDCGTRLPSVYTRIASYADWIESIVWP